jgi:hypothetical protein
MAVKVLVMWNFRRFVGLVAVALAMAACSRAAVSAGTPYGEQRLLATKQGRPGVIALIGGKGPYTFIIDTGSSQTILSEALIASLGAEAKPGAPVTVTTASGSVTSQVYRVRDVATAGVTLEDLDVVRSPVPAVIGADGIFGSDFLSNFNIELDWIEGKFRLYPSGTLPKLDGLTHARGKLDKRLLLVFPGRCRTTRCNVVLDTGGLVSLGNLSLGQILPPAIQPTVAINFLEVNGLQTSGVQAQAKILTRLQVGGFLWSNRDVAIADLPVFRQLDDPSRPTLFMGLDILGKGRLVVDYDRATMYFRR